MRSEKRHKTGSESNLDELTLEFIGKYGPTSVQRLHEALRINNPSLTELEVVDIVWRLSDDGKAQLEDAWPVTKPFTSFLGLWERHLSLYGSLVFAFAVNLLIYAVPSGSPWVVFRWVLGSVFVLFIPGYATVEALFPETGELNSLERFALSIGLSLALAPLIGLFLNYTPWGIRLAPIVISLTIISLGMVLVSLVRRYFHQSLIS
ncbi:MAG TPA: DUF1616 domain-containing protein [Candidatus Acidoferrales bacterium]|nr:DUF1616 domain-containing protein [Candidatus Acidoferrales bacterium]